MGDRHVAMMTRDDQSSEEIESTKREYSRLAQRADDSAEMFLKHAIPRLCDFESLESYTEALAVFMQLWRDEAKRRSEIGGETTLIDWTWQLRKTRADTIGQLKLAVIDIGKRISSHPINYFRFLAATVNREGLEMKTRQIKTAIGCLKVEENSIVIDTLAKVLKYIEEVLKWNEAMGSREEGGGNNSGAWGIGSEESEWIRLIMEQVLQFEVGFCCPDLPMMMIDEFLLGMANRLREMFDKKLEAVEWETKSRASTRVQNRVLLEALQDLLEPEMELFWDKLDILTVPN